MSEERKPDALDEHIHETWRPFREAAGSLGDSIADLQSALAAMTAERDGLKKELECQKILRDDQFEALRIWKERTERMEKALNLIRTSAPCLKDHMSFNTPGQFCDQRIAKEALDDGKGVA